MEESKKANLKDLTTAEKAHLKKTLTENFELMDLQARTAEARARIVKAHVEEYLYSLKMHEFQNPKEETENEHAKTDS